MFKIAFCMVFIPLIIHATKTSKEEGSLPKSTVSQVRSPETNHRTELSKNKGFQKSPKVIERRNLHTVVKRGKSSDDVVQQIMDAE